MYWILFIAIAVVSAIAQYGVKSKMEKYSKVPLSSDLTGAEIARKMLAAHGIKDVTVQSVGGYLTDHYNPATKVVNLSRDVYYSNSVAAAAVAAHECGHAVQHAYGYAPLRLRSAMVPVVSFASRWMTWVILAGLLCFKAFPQLLVIGIAMYALTTLFAFVTLPVELNASARALEWLEGTRLTDYNTAPMAKSALKSAAYTYVVAALASLATLLYYITILNRR